MPRGLLLLAVVFFSVNFAAFDSTYAGSCFGGVPGSSGGDSTDNQEDNCEGTGGCSGGSFSSIALGRGALYFSDTPLSVRSHLDIDVKLAYNSGLIGMNGAHLPTTSSFSPGWTWKYDAAFITIVSVNGVPYNEGLAYRFLGNSVIDGYRSTDGINYVPSSGVYDFAKRNSSNGMQYTTKHGRTLKFDDSFLKSYTITTPAGNAVVNVKVYMLTGISDRNGNTITVNRDASHAVTSVVSSDGASITVASEPHPLYPGFKRVTSISSSDGRTVEFAYDAANALKSFTNPAGEKKEFTYAPNFLMLSQRHAADATGWDVVYDAEERVAKKTLTSGAEWNIVYHYTTTFDPNTLRLQYSDGYTDYTTPDGRTVRRFYDSRGNFTKEIEGTRVTEKEWNHDSAWRVRTKSNPDGTSLNFEYNALGDKTKSVDQAGRQILRTFDPVFHNMTSMTDQNGKTTTFTYDAKGNLLSKTDANGHTWRFEWNAKGDKIKQTCPCGFSTLYEYDVYGEIVKKTDPLGNVTTYEYDQYGHLSKTTDPEGKSIAFENDVLGRKIFEWDKNGNISHFAYDSYGNIVAVVGPLGDYNDDGVIDKNDVAAAVDDHFLQTFTYDWKGAKTSSIDETGRLTEYRRSYNSLLLKLIRPDGTFFEYAYDVRGNRISSKDPMGRVTRFEYDTMNRLTKTTDPLNRETILAYDVSGRLVSKKLPGDRTWTYTYTPTGKIATETDPEGGVTSFSYDDVGNLVSKTSPDNATETYSYNPVNLPDTITDPLGATTKFFYDAAARKIKTEDKNGHSTLFRYNKRGEITEREDAAGSITEFAYDPNGNVVKITDALGGETRFSYDFRNRKIKTVNAAGGVSVREYDLNGNLAFSKDPNGNETSYLYDNMDRLVKQTNPAGGHVAYEYDANGNIVKTIDSHSIAATFEYDELNRLVKTTDNAGNSSTTVYDAAGFTASTTNRNGATTTFEYDKNGRLVKKTDALGESTLMAYHPDGALHVLTDANGNETTFEYDALNQLTVKKFADGGEIRYAYDPNGNLVAKTDQKGNAFAYTYDVLDRLTKKETTPIPGVPGTTIQTFSYDSLGRLVAATDDNDPDDPADDAIIARTYDALGNLKSETLNGKRIKYAYDANSNIKKITYQSGLVARRRFNSLNKISRIRVAGRRRVDVKFKYDDLGKITRKKYSRKLFTKYEYDNLNRIESLKTFAKHGWRNRHRRLVDGFEYQYDSVGNKLAAVNLTTLDDSQVYEYDAINQIKGYDGGADTALWNYDPMGNWNSVTIDGTVENRTHNEVNELTSRDSAPLTYDDNGNLTAAELATGEWTFTFNADNRLVSAVSDDAKLAFAYDAFGRRILKKTYLPCWRGRGRHHRRSWQPVREERFFYDKYNMTQIYRKFSCWGWGGRLRLSRSFIWGDDLSGKEQGAGGVGGLVAVVKHYGVFYPTYNAGNGNITAYMTKRGRVVARYVYSPFGRIIKKTGLLADYFTYAFSTKPLDRETTLVYYNHRYYSPQLGRWLSRDPIEEDGGYNLYAMVNNAPILLIDADGRFISWLAAGAGALVGAAVSTGVYVVSSIATGHEMTAGGLTGAAVGGAVSGAIIGAVATAVVDPTAAIGAATISMVTTAGVGAAVTTVGIAGAAGGAAGSITQQIIDDGSVNASQVSVAAGTSGLFSIATLGISSYTQGGLWYFGQINTPWILGLGTGFAQGSLEGSIQNINDCYCNLEAAAANQPIR